MLPALLDHQDGHTTTPNLRTQLIPTPSSQPRRPEPYPPPRATTLPSHPPPTTTVAAPLFPFSTQSVPVPCMHACRPHRTHQTRSTRMRAKMARYGARIKSTTGYARESLRPRWMQVFAVESGNGNGKWEMALCTVDGKKTKKKIQKPPTKAMVITSLVTRYSTYHQAGREKQRREKSCKAESEVMYQAGRRGERRRGGEERGTESQMPKTHWGTP